MNLLALSWKNLVNKPLSMLLSLVLFALGVGLISLLFLLNQQLQDKFDKNLAGIDLVVGAKGSPLQLILSSMYHIDAPTGNISIEEATPFLRPGHPLIKTAVPLSLGDSHKGYRINKYLHALVDPDHRQKFKDNEEASLAAADLTDHERDMIRRRDWRAMIQYGVIFFMMEKLAAVVGSSNLHVYAAMRGESFEDFMKTRNAPGALYSVAGRDAKSLDWDKKAS